jgi:5-methylcytosine-specific restriction protein A
MDRLRTLRDPGRKLGYGGRFLDRTRAQVSRERDARLDWRAWGKTARWQRLRWSVLIRDDFTCQRCGHEHRLAALARALKAIGRPDLIKGKAPDLVADHTLAHKGDEALFWDEGNLQCLCKPCHDRDKQRDERAAPP